MKQILQLAIVLLSCVTMAKTHSINGTKVYILCEPVRSYEIVNTADNNVKWGSFFTMGLINDTMGLINDSISKKVTKFIKALQEEFLKEGVKFDAVLYDSGKEIVAIKYIDEPTLKTKGIATIHKLSGIPFYVMSDPMEDYKLISNIGNGIMWKSLVTAGLWNNSIEQDLMKFAGKVEGKFKRNKISALIYSNGKKAISIKF